jgi:hypothetical protein
MLLTDEDVQRIATLAVETYIRALEDEGMLSESSDFVLANYSVVSYKKGFWGSVVERLFGIDKDENREKIYFRTVKQIIHSKRQKQDSSGPGAKVFRLIDSKDEDER